MLSRLQKTLSETATVPIGNRDSFYSSIGRGLSRKNLNMYHHETWGYFLPSGTGNHCRDGFRPCPSDSFCSYFTLYGEQNELLAIL